MRLNWMGKYRNFLEQLIRFGNLYAQAYKVEDSYTESTSFSPAQIQIMECILENEDNNLKMAEIASNLGVTPSSFSKNIKKMTEKGLLEKYHTNHNKKMLSSAYHHSVENFTKIMSVLHMTEHTRKSFKYLIKFQPNILNSLPAFLKFPLIRHNWINCLRRKSS